MTRHVRYKQLNKVTIKQATINSIILKTPTINENIEVFKSIGIYDRGFFWMSPRKWHKNKTDNMIFLFDLKYDYTSIIYPKG